VVAAGLRDRAGTRSRRDKGYRSGVDILAALSGRRQALGLEFLAGPDVNLLKLPWLVLDCGGAIVAMAAVTYFVIPEETADARDIKMVRVLLSVVVIVPCCSASARHRLGMALDAGCSACSR